MSKDISAIRPGNGQIIIPTITAIMNKAMVVNFIASFIIFDNSLNDNFSKFF